jgi:hypothetical protein
MFSTLAESSAGKRRRFAVPVWEGPVQRSQTEHPFVAMSGQEVLSDTDRPVRNSRTDASFSARKKSTYSRRRANRLQTYCGTKLAYPVPIHTRSRYRRDESSAKAEGKGPRPPCKRMHFKQMQMALRVHSVNVRKLRQKENDFKDREIFG